MADTVKFKIVLESNGEKMLHNLTINTEDFVDAVKLATTETQKLSNELNAFSKGAIVFSSMTTVVEQLHNTIGAIADDFNSFDKGMRAVNTMAGLGKKELKDLTGQVEELANTIPLAKSELANGLYQVISNGVPQDNWINFLNASAKSAVGGIADLGQTVTVTSTIIKNYGLEWDAAASIQDKIQMTAKNGVTSFEQLGQALPRVTGSAATLGVSIDELMATFATLTGVSGNTAEVSTQLAAIFTALIKPSSEAAEMAAQMGIQFDAAAIKAAGGMQNFVTQISSDIVKFAESSGMLETEIYGKLFGSAESLRALIPLTGELADKYIENVGAMANANGTIEQAFSSMAGSGESVAQILENKLSSAFSFVGEVASNIQPYITYLAVLGQSIMAIKVLKNSTKGLVLAINAMIGAQTKASIATMASTVHEKVQAIARNMLAAAGYTAAAGTTALTVATVALYSALTLGLSAVITGIITLLTSLFSASNEAAEGVDTLADANDSFNSTVANTKAELDLEIAKLKELINSNGDTAETIDKLNQKYGEAFGIHNTAAEWYDTLITKSKAYCNQLGYEAQAKVLASKIAENELKMQEMESSGTHQEKKMETSYTWARGVQVKKVTVETDEYATIKAENEKLKESFNTCLGKAAEASKELNRTTEENTASVTWQTMSYADLGKAIESQKGKVEKLAGTNNKAAKAEASLLKQMETRYNALGKQYGLNKGNSSNADNDKYNGKNLIADAKSYKELGNNIKYYKNQLEEADSSNTELISNISKQIASLETEQDKVLDLQERASLPIEENSIDNITKKIAYQQKIRKTATIDQIAGIDAEIARLNELLKAFEDSSKPELNIEKINTYEQLDKAISYYESKLKTASAAERAEFQKSINILKNKRDEWDASLETLNVPAEIGNLDTISKLDNAISFYSERMNNASATEIAGIQKVIIALQAKRTAMQQLADIPTMQQELNNLQGLSGQKLQMELELIGIEAIKAKIRQLQAMLANTNNPLNEQQRGEVEETIDQWEQYAATLETSKNKGDLITGSINNLSSLMGSLSGVVGEGAGAWLSYGANILSVVAAALPAIASVIGGNIAQAFAGATAQSQTVPFPYNLIALSASLAAVGAAVASIPKFANGGIAYGPTLGLFGEYAGASTNPEVVAPLNKLKSIIGINEDLGGGEVRFRIEGRSLVGILEKESKRRERTR